MSDSTAPLPAAIAMRTGDAVWLETLSERDARFPALRGFEATTVALCAVLLIVGGRTLGALRFSFAARRLFDQDERAFALCLAAQTAQTLHRTELYAAERDASQQMQRALLPGQMPSIAGFTSPRSTARPAARKPEAISTMSSPCPPSAR